MSILDRSSPNDHNPILIHFAILLEKENNSHRMVHTSHSLYAKESWSRGCIIKVTT